MYYGSTTKSTNHEPNDWRIKIARALLWFIPRSAPDHELLYPSVRKWLVEIDEKGNANREIGLGKDNAPLFAAPEGRNIGFWTDSPYAFSREELAPIEASEFERLWLQCIPESSRKMG